MPGKGISIDRTKRLREEPHKGHNRWHPDIAPVIEVEPGEEVTLETRDAMDLQIGPRTTVKDLEKMERTVAHPLTGPVYVKGAKPGDLLEIEHLDIRPERYGWTRFSPGFGLLAPAFTWLVKFRKWLSITLSRSRSMRPMSSFSFSNRPVTRSRSSSISSGRTNRRPRGRWAAIWRVAAPAAARREHPSMRSPIKRPATSS